MHHFWGSGFFQRLLAGAGKLDKVRRGCGVGENLDGGGTATAGGGEKETETVQFTPTLIEVPQVLPSMMKSEGLAPITEMPLKLTGADPLLVI